MIRLAGEGLATSLKPAASKTLGNPMKELVGGTPSLLGTVGYASTMRAP